MKKGYADLPLHGGKAPRWLFDRMVSLSTVIIEALLSEFSVSVVLKRLSDPVWFQSLGNVLGFDWHSSGLSTVTAGAVKQAIKKVSPYSNLYAAGGKGRYALKTPENIIYYGNKYSFNPKPIINASKLSAKVDNSCIQDGFNIYHHTIFFTKQGEWCVVQQGLNKLNKRARRYHWYSKKIVDFTEEPHTGIKAEKKEKNVLNLIAKKSNKNKKGILDLIQNNPDNLEKKLKKITFPTKHNISLSDLNIKNIKKISTKTYMKTLKKFEDFLKIKGTGPKTIRALSLTAAIIYGSEPSFEDPVLFSYAHGGKDGIPYPVDRPTYDRTTKIIRNAIKKSKLGNREKLEALKKLSKLI